MAISQRTRERRIAEQQARVTPLHDLPLDYQDEIAWEVAQDTPPPAEISFELCIMPNRAWYEWHWQRGMDPHERRAGVPKRLRAIVIERDGLVCGICHLDVPADDVHVDHITPVARGGSDALTNLRVTHSRCNLSKGARS